MEQEETLTSSFVTVVDVQFRPGQKVYYFDPAGKEYLPGDHLIIETARGPEYGICTAGNHQIPQKDVVAPLREVIRLATAQDEKILADNRAKEKKAYDICLQKIGEHKLDMQLVSAECAFDGSKLLFFFTADERVDFRDLVKSLAGIFHTRIELRQIGVRDKAKMVGGLGICGRPFCCASFLDDFQPVSIKMAKVQNLSLNPTKISGTCGRLMCCLKHEQETYEDLIRSSPKAESFVDTPDGRGTITDVELLTGKVKVRMERNPDAVNTYAIGDIAILRSGKAKKNDPPIPDDLAPISGGASRPVKSAAASRQEPVLEPIRFRYSEETLTDEKEEAPVPAPKPKKSKKPRPEKQHSPKIREETSEKQESAPAREEKPEGESKPKPKNRNRYRRYRKNHPSTPSEG